MIVNIKKQILNIGQKKQISNKKKKVMKKFISIKNAKGKNNVDFKTIMMKG